MNNPIETKKNNEREYYFETKENDISKIPRQTKEHNEAELNQGPEKTMTQFNPNTSLINQSTSYRSPDDIY